MSSAATWYLRRLLAMSPAEIGYRLGQRAKIEQERRFGAFSARLWAQNSYQVPKGYRLFREQAVPFFFSWDERETALTIERERFNEGLIASERLARSACAHQFTVFGREFQYDRNQVDWHRDPKTSRQWPRRFWSEIDIRDAESFEGVKWVWELNRHHHLVTLGKSYFLSGNPQYAQEICLQISDWIESNPLHIGVNWTSSLELAIRLINWTWTLAFIRRSPELTAERFELILRSIYAQAHHIARHLSAHSSANNHLIGEAAALAIVALSFPWLPSAGQWRDKGLEILARELDRQIYPDGVPAEQAMHYLAFDLDLNLLVWRLVELNGGSVPAIWHQRLGVASDFLFKVMDEDGNVPGIGDSDDAWVVRLDDTPGANNYRSILATAAVLLQRPEYKASAQSWDEKSHWILGAQGLATFDSLPAEAPRIASRAFRSGGYCVMRAPGRIVVFDCGPLGYLSIAAHAHADALSLSVSLDGQPLIIDPGTFAYQEGGERRGFFRSTAAHNTVVVDRRSQSEMLGTFLWGRKANTRLLHWQSTPEYDLAMAEHDGYSRLGVTHRRTVMFRKPDWLVVEDQLRGQGQHVFEQLWHLPVDGEAIIGSDQVTLSVGQKKAIVIPVEVPGTLTQVRKGEEQPMQGWVSPRYGQIEPAPVISFSGRSHLPVRLVTALYLAPETRITNLTERAAQMLDFLDDLDRKVNI